MTNVDKVPVQHEDRMETFLMVDTSLSRESVTLTGFLLQGETLKYLYLLFSDASVLPLSGEWQLCICYVSSLISH